MNINMAWLSFSPFRNSIGTSPSSLKRWWDNNVLLATKDIVEDVALGVCKTSSITMFFISSRDSLQFSFGDRMCMHFEVDGCSWQIGQWMNHIIHAVYTSLHAHGGKTTNFTSSGARRGRWDNFANNRNLARIIVLVDFIADTISEKHRIRVVLAMTMAQAFSISKAQTKGVFNVGHFHLAPSHDCHILCPCFAYIWKLPLACI